MFSTELASLPPCLVQEGVVALALSEIFEVVDECVDFIRPAVVLDSGTGHQVI